MSKILVVIDMQNDFITGSLGTEEAVKILPRVEEKIKDFKGTVLFTRDTHFDNYLDTAEGKKLPVKHCIKDTFGWQIYDSLEKYCTVKPFDKSTFGSIELAEKLKEMNESEPIEKITLVGVCTDICVISNVMLIKAMLPEVSIVVDESCCAGVTPESHKNAILAMKMCQIEVL